MTKLIGIKELQTNTKSIREQVENGVHFIVVYRSKPVFEIHPVSDDLSFSADFEKTGKYNENFIDRMKEAESDLNSKNFKTYKNNDEFLNSLDK